MNRASEIIDYLSNPQNPDVLILAPKAPPVSRSNREIRVAIASVFDAQDVNDTLIAFRTRAQATSAEAALTLSGGFSFGIKDIGRFRVTYATQRGSRILSIARIPQVIPDLRSLCANPALYEKAVYLLKTCLPGLLMVCGPNAISNAIFSYSLLNAVNHSFRRVVCILENNLTFLMKHENSIVIQCELNTDMRTMNEGVNSISLFEPDILHVGDIRPGDEIAGITRAVENGVMVILSSVMLGPKALLNRYNPTPNRLNTSPHFNGNAFVIQADENGALSITFTDDLLES